MSNGQIQGDVGGVHTPTAQRETPSSGTETVARSVIANTSVPELRRRASEEVKKARTVVIGLFALAAAIYIFSAFYPTLGILKRLG